MLTRQHLLLRTRCALVLIAATVAATVLVRALLDEVAAPTRSVDQTLVRLCLVALAGATAWTWLATLSVVAEAWQGRPARRRAVTPLRRFVLMCCGVALAAPLAPAAADEHPAPEPGIAGLPLPDRATGPAHEDPISAVVHPHARRTVVVRAGDCLWRLAAADLPDRASAARVTARWHAIHRLNAEVIGPDPDLIRPGQRLALPPRPTR